VKTIPGYCENPFAFPPESLFTFTPESCSPSPRNAFHVHPGIPFTFPRNPQQRPPRLDMENYPHLPTAEVALTRAADYQVLLLEAV
jgi:hypothetical protein